MSFFLVNVNEQTEQLNVWLLFFLLKVDLFCSWLKLTCVWCDYKTTSGDLMAKHLAKFPKHARCVFSLKGEYYF